MAKYRKKPVVIEAEIWTVNRINAIASFMGKYPKVIDRRVRIQTLEGAMYAEEGDYIIKGVNGEFYPCKPDIFTKTYEKEGE